MTDQDLTRLEHQIGRVLRLGVMLSAGALGLGLLLSFARVTAAAWLLDAGLVLLMAIPVARIAASFGDAVRRRDRLLGWATAIVLSVMAATLLYQVVG